MNDIYPDTAICGDCIPARGDAKILYSGGDRLSSEKKELILF